MRPKILDRIIFLHVPKTAGTSLRNVLDRFFEDSEKLYLYEGLSSVNIAEYRERATHARLVFGHLSMGCHHELNIEPCYGAMLRHPIQRVISIYGHFSRDPKSPFYDDIRGGMTLSEFIESGRTEQTNNHMVRMFMNWPGELPGFIFDEKYFRRAMDLIEAQFKYIGFQENFSESLRKLCSLMGCSTPEVIPRLNKGEATSIEVSKEDYACIARFNNLDLQLYETLASERGGLVP